MEYWEGLIDRYRKSPASGPELIRQDLNETFQFNTEYKSSEWSSTSQTHTLTLWNSATKEETSLEAEILISANGPLSTPQIPELPGLQSFRGIKFHNLRWDKTVDFSNKRVAVIGNGSSAVQLIVSTIGCRSLWKPGIAKLPGTHVTQFIRSGGYYFPKRK